MAGSDGRRLFVVGSLLFSAAVVPLTLANERDPVVPGPNDVPALYLPSRAPLGVVGVLLGGLTQGAILGMGVVYGHAAGLSVGEISSFMVLAVAGGFVFEWPFGWLSDRIDRRKLILAVSAAGSLAAVVATTAGSVGANMASIGVVGALTFPLYPLAVAHANDHLTGEQMVPAASQLLAVGGFGAMLGPVAVAVGMHFMGAHGFFWCLAVATALLAVSTALTIGFGAPVSRDEQTPYVTLQTSATANAMALHPQAADLSPDRPESR